MNYRSLRTRPVTAVTVSLISITLSFSALNAAAPLDDSLNTTLNGSVSSLALQSDGKIIIGGGFTTVNGAAKSYLARLNADGSLDDSFAPANAPGQFVSRVVVANCKIYVGAGDGLRRFSTNGALDWHYPMSVATFAVDSQARVIVGGQFVRIENQPHRNIARLTAAGALDSSFSAAIGCCAGESVDALATQGDSILVGGLFQSVNGTSGVSHFARVSADGSLDVSFNGGDTSRVLSIVTTADGKVYRASEQSLSRRLADGANDPGFAPVSSGGSSDDRFVTVAVGADGKPVAGGSFSLDGGATRSFVARFNADGSRDDSFAVLPNAQVNAVAVQTDGRVLIGGWFTEVNGSARMGLARLDTPSAAPALSIAVGPNGNVVLSWPEGGSFVLETKTLNDDTWTAHGNSPIVINGKNCVTASCSGFGNLYRLRAL